MSRPWDRTLRSLRRWTLWTSVISHVGRFLYYLTPAVLVLVGIGFLKPVLRLSIGSFGLLLLPLLIAAVAVGWRRGRRSYGYLAKQIDLATGLADRLTSAAEWARLPELDPFQHRCIEQLTLELNARRWQLVVPRARPANLGGLLFGAVGALAVAVISQRQRPVTFEPDAHARVSVSRQLLVDSMRVASQLKVDGRALSNSPLEQIADDLSLAVRDLEQHHLDRQASLARLEQIRQMIDASGQPNDVANLPGRGAVGRLQSALAKGDLTALAAALGETAERLAKESLSEDELAQLEPLLGALSVLARGAPGPLSETLHQAMVRLRGNDQIGVSQSIHSSLGQLTSLSKPLGLSSARTAASETVRKLIEAARDEDAGLPVATSNNAAQRKAANDFSMPSTPLGAGSPAQPTESDEVPTAAGARSADGHPATALRPSHSELDVQLLGTRAGQVLRQLFDGSSTGNADDRARRLLLEHARVAEDHFRRDDVPKEYQDAVRSYFATLHEREQAWTRTRK